MEHTAINTPKITQQLDLDWMDVSSEFGGWLWIKNNRTTAFDSWFSFQNEIGTC
jgi:hypothetical protein